MAEENKKVPDKKPIQATTKNRNSVASELGNYAMNEIILPKSKEVMRDMFMGIVNMFADCARNTMDKFLYPDGNAPRKNSQGNNYYGTTNYTSYSRPINQYQPSQQRRDSIGQRSGCDVRMIWVRTEEDAKEIVATLKEEIDNYGKAKVATLYEKIRERTSFADFKYGWTKDHEGQIGYFYDTKCPDSSSPWFIDLPKPVDISNV